MLLPCRQIRWLIDREHVGRPEAEIAAAMRRRTEGWPLAARVRAVRYAVAVHRHNRQLYRAVTSGTLSPT